MSASLSDLRRVFETATANVDKVSFTITALPATAEHLIAMLSAARAAGRSSGAALRRIELPRIAAQSFGKNFHEVAVGEADGADVLRLFFARDTSSFQATA
ncbi:MAG: hypothetical protein JOZ84_18055 [Methylobacteriaceae bacterium]|nr:hypothetical protein [Methylobacteriaceae bacterium]